MANIMDFWRNEWKSVGNYSAVNSSDSLLSFDYNDIRDVLIVVSAKKIGKAKTWTYPYDDGNKYEIPTYELSLIGTNNGLKVCRYYEILRFGVTRKTENSLPYVVGLADKQRHTIKGWIPTYEVHSSESQEKGAWQVYGNFLIHDGPDDPLSDSYCYASIGCVEICGGPNGFNKFNDDIILLSGIKDFSREEQLKIIGKSGKLVIEYEKAERPPLVKL